MHQIPVLRDLVILVAVAIPVVIIAQRLRVPTVVGFLLTGIAIGPNALGLVARPDSVASLAELGVVLLLFAIGLELSLSRIVRMGQWVIRGGGIQVLATIAVIAAIGLAFGRPWRLSLLAGTGGSIATSLRTILLSVIVVAALVLGGRLVVPRALRRVAELRNREI